MSAAPSKLAASFPKLTELGRALLLINNAPGLSRDEKTFLKNRALDKDETVFAATKVFEVEQDLEDAADTFKRIVTIGNPPEEDLTRKRKSSVQTQPASRRSSAAPAARARARSFVDDISELRELTGLQHYHVDEVMDRMISAAPKGYFTPLTFSQCFKAFMPKTGDDEQRDKYKRILERLFILFDADKNGVVDLTELASGLSLLCGGSLDDKITNAFALFDLNGDGYISLEEMKTYLASIFRVLFEVSPETAQAVGASSTVLADATAQECFAQADKDGDGRISFEEFKKWYSSPLMQHLQSMSSDIDLISAQAARPARKVSIKDSLTPLEELRQRSGLAAVNALDAVAHLTSVATNGSLDRQSFARAVISLLQKNKVKAADPKTIAHVFDIFDKDRNGVVDMDEMLSGLTMMCGGTEQDKVRAAFALFDMNGDGYISLEEMTKYMASVFRVMYDAKPSLKEELGVSAEDLGSVTAAQCFRLVDKNADGKVSFEEFTHWFRSAHSSNLDSTQRQMQDQATAQPAKRKGSGNFQLDLEELRQTSRLGVIPVATALNVLISCAEDNKLTRSQFTEAMLMLMEHSEATFSSSKEVEKVISRLFRVFDTDGNGVVDISEMAGGVALLCYGSHDDRVQAVFALLDENVDGFISPREMLQFMTSVLRVVYDASPEVEEAVGVSAEVLALETTKQCFLQADTDNDGQLSYEEFEVWYSSPKGLGPSMFASGSDSEQPTSRL
eukprot:GILK01000559.1.p1 GENE.GILK01000559.1~~GILK01000559.1.p1  ORF type:complete len:734 (-),score=141.90 GILK01000559.1:152-2353(-)